MTATYTSAASIKTSAQITYSALGFSTDGDYSTFIETLINRAERLIDDYVKAPPLFFKAGGVAISDEYHDGDGSDAVALSYYPVISVSSVAENTAALTESASWAARTAGPGASGSYILRPESGVLVFYRDAPGVGVRNVKVSYTPGYSSVPGPVAEVCEELVVNAVRSLLSRKVLPTELTQVVMNGGDVRELLSDAMSLTAAHRRGLAAYRFPGVSVG